MATYQYVNSQGQLQTVNANSSTEALNSAPNIASNSGVQLLPQAAQLPNISAATLNQQAPALSVPPTVTTSNPASFVASLQVPQLSLPTINPLAPGAVTQATSNISKLEGQSAELQQELLNAYNQLGGKGTETLAMENQAGIPQTTQQLQNLNLEIAQKTAAYNATQQNYRSGQILDQVSSGKIQQLEVQKAVEIGGLAAVAQALQGNITLAQQTIDRTIQLKYEPIEQRIEATKAFLDINANNLSKAEQVQSAAINIQLQQQKDNLDFLRSTQSTLLNAALSNKSSPDTISALLKANTLGELSSAYGTSLGTSGQIASIINPTTGLIDPTAQLASIINSSGAKTDDKLKLTGSVVSAIQTFAQNNPSGDFPGLGIIRPGPLTIGPIGQSNQTYLSALEGTIESWMTGAAVSDDQAKRIKDTMVPRVSDPDWIVRNKLNALTNYMLSYASGSLATQGVTYQPPKIDFFKPTNFVSLSNTDLLNLVPSGSGLDNTSFFNQF